MNIDVCKEQIKRHEGEVLEIYEDSLGYKTLGIGHLCQPQDPEYDWEVGTKVSQEVVDMYYEDDFEKHYIGSYTCIWNKHEDWDGLTRSYTTCYS